MLCVPCLGAIIFRGATDLFARLGAPSFATAFYYMTSSAFRDEDYGALRGPLSDVMKLNGFV